MGYTNYWHKYNDFTESEWKQIKEEFNYIKEVVGFLIKDESTNDINETLWLFLETHFCCIMK